jgi:hypothetical protein
MSEEPIQAGGETAERQLAGRDRLESSGIETVRAPGSFAAVGRLRWLLAIVVSIVVIAGSVAIAALVVGGAGPSGLLARAPGDSLLYAELRFDLPGSQRAAVGRFLSAFPGFDDQALLEAKLDDLFERAVVAASDGRLHWSGGIEAWFGGEAAVVVRGLAKRIGAGTELPVPLLLATVVDPAAARSWVTGALDATGVPWTRDTIAGADAILVGGAVDARAVAVTETLLVGGRVDDVRAALETTPASSLGAADRPKAAAAALPADHVAWLYVDGVAYRAWLAGLLAGTDTSLSTALLSPALIEIPDWASVELRFDGDRLVVEAATPTGGTAATDAPSRLAGLVPRDAVAFVGVGGVGPRLTERARVLQADPALGPALEPVFATLDRIGGVEALVGWIDELGFVVGVEGEKPWAAVVAAPRDRAAAESLAGSLLNLARLGLPGLRIDEETAGGRTIVSAELPGPAAGSGDGRVGLAWAIGDVVVVGPDAATVRRILGVEPGASLADEARYATLLARAGGPAGSSVAFLDLARLRSLVEAKLMPAERTRYERDIRPYLVPFDAAVALTRTDGGIQRTVVLVRATAVE